ncbi:chaperonin 10-like protein [Mycena capillaripes]|nr:chaperonin 10-like protein [Mycena capillaripes]
MATEKQSSLAVTYKGSPFTIIRHAIPTPGLGDLLVRVEGAGLNPAEWKLQTGVFDADTITGGVYPVFFGTDGAGTVIDVGGGVTNFSKGDRVLFQGCFNAERNAFQEYTLVEANLTAKIPETMSCLEAASIPMALATAALGLGQEFPAVAREEFPAVARKEVPAVASERGGAGLKPLWEEGAQGYYSGKAILVLGGASMVGQYVIQIAKYMGYSAIIITSSLKHSGYLESLGATHVIDRYGDTAAAVEKLKRDLGIEIGVVYDAVHTPITQAEVDLLSPNGTLLSIWELPKDGELQFKDGRRATANFGSVQFYKDLGKQMYASMGHFLERGIIKPARIEKLSGGLAGIAAGSERLRKNEVSGIKLVVDPREAADV